MSGAHVQEWLHLLVRWLHVVAGAAWIGTSFYFNFLNNGLRPPREPSERVSGELWAVHGGGFYHVEKFAVAPETLPEKLHWFKWEAYTTWLSGASLLVLVYYLGPGATMVDPAVADVSQGVLTAVGVGTLIAGWLVYDLLCRTSLLARPALFSIVGIVGVGGVAYGLSQLMSGRAAYIHVGAVLGTLMVGNVFGVIIPSQREMVDAMASGREPDAVLGKHAGLRSLHNNYLTLPVLFVMVSNHFPFTFQDGANWAVLAVVTIAGAGIRHWFNLRGQGRRNAYLLPVATGLLVATAFVTAPTPVAPPADSAQVVSDEEVMAIVGRRCASCHAVAPTQEGFAAPPKGIVFATPDDVRARAADVRRVAVDSTYMPLGNLTGMTEEERGQLGAWLDGLG